MKKSARATRKDMRMFVEFKRPVNRNGRLSCGEGRFAGLPLFLRLPKPASPRRTARSDSNRNWSDGRTNVTSRLRSNGCPSVHRRSSLEPNGLADVWADVRRVAQSLGAPERGEQVVAALQQRMATIAAKANTAGHRPTVACIEWIEPLMAAGNWLPELVEMAGGVNLFGEAGKHSPWMTWEELVAKDPDVIFISPCGFDIARTLQETHLLTGKPEWTGLKAVQSNRVFVADGNQYFNRPGPRLVESLEILAEVLHPAIFRFGHEIISIA